MRELFQNIRTSEELPEKVKTEVFKTINTMRLLADIFDLFAIKFPQAEMRLIDLARMQEDRHDPAGISDDSAVRKGKDED